MDQKQLRDYYCHLTNMTSQVDSYIYAIGQNIEGSSPHWNVDSNVISEVKFALDRVENNIKKVIYWAEKARDISYEPSEDEKSLIYEMTNYTYLSVFGLEDVFKTRILHKSPPEWVEKVQIFIKQLKFYIEEIMKIFKPSTR